MPRRCRAWSPYRLVLRLRERPAPHRIGRRWDSVSLRPAHGSGQDANAPHFTTAIRYRNEKVAPQCRDNAVHHLLAEELSRTLTPLPKPSLTV